MRSVKRTYEAVNKDEKVIHDCIVAILNDCEELESAEEREREKEKEGDGDASL